jgi:hypothetical protein
MTPTRYHRLSVCLLALGACSSPPPPEETPEVQQHALATAAPLAVQIDVRPQSGRVPIRFTLRNTGAEPITALRWNTPLEGWKSDLFQVTRDGRPVAYVGRLVKRGPVRAADQVTIEPGAEVSAELDLAEGYALDAHGRYQVVYQGTLAGVTVGRVPATTPAASRQALRSNAVAFELTAPLPRRRLARRRPARASASTAPAP